MMLPYKFCLPILLMLALTSCKQGTILEENLSLTDRVVVGLTSDTGQNLSVTIADSANLQKLRELPKGRKCNNLRCSTELDVLFMKGADTMAIGGYHAISKIFVFYEVKGDDVDSSYVFCTPPSVDSVLQAAFKELEDRKYASRFDWFLGKWTQTEPDGGVSFETWRRGQSGNLLGHAYTLKGADTTFEENMELRVEGKDAYYVVTVDKEEGPVTFKLVEENGQYVVFNKKRSDFPQMISYRAIGDSGLFARISGYQGTQYGEVDFPLKRVRE